MGVGTNVQDRAIALHHLDAPWRPADVAQREGRILRQGNLNPEVQVLRYTVTGSFDGYMWQALERKARFIAQVMHGRLDTREISDIGDAALSFSEIKALATGNPLLIDKAEADADLARLQRAERAHYRNQDALEYAIRRHQADIQALTLLAADLDIAVTRRQDTRGDAFTMTVGDRKHTKRPEAGRHLKELLEREITALDGVRLRAAHPGYLGGFPLTAAVERSRREIAHARQNLGQPFPQAAQLTQARDRARHIDEQISQLATEHQASDTAAHQPGQGHDARQQPEASTPRSATIEADAPHRQPTGAAPAPARTPAAAPGTAGHNQRAPGRQGEPQSEKEENLSRRRPTDRERVHGTSDHQPWPPDWQDHLVRTGRETWVPGPIQPPATGMIRDLEYGGPELEA